MTIRNTKGFTLIELLVVIAIIGVLAAVVLIAIDPLEQINRAKDSGVKSDVNAVGNAEQSYFTAQGGGTSTVSTFPVSDSTGNLTALVNSGDLKSAPSTKVIICSNNDGSTTCSTTCASTGGNQCTYSIAYATINSNQSVSQANAALGITTCTKTTTYFAYSASPTITKAGWYCGASAPPPGATVK